MEKNRYYNAACAFVIIIAAFIYATLMFNNNVWYDEAYTLAMIPHSFSDILRITAEDVHPPLYYFALKIFCSFGGDVLIMSKIFSIIPIVLMMILGYVQLGKIFDKKTALAFVLLVALMPLYQGFSVEVRMYTWASFTVFGCGVFAYRAITSGKIRHFVFYSLFGVASAYLHYFAFVSVLIIYFFAFVGAIKKKKFLPWLISALASLASYIPWMSAFIMQLGEKVTSEYWIAPITLEVIKGYFDVWLKCGEYTYIYKFVFAAMLVGCIIAVIITKNKERIRVLLLGVSVFVLTCVIGIVASVLVRPVFIERYAIPAIGLVLASMAAGIGVVKSRIVLSLITAVGIAASAINYPSAYDIEYNSSEKNIEYVIEGSDYDALVCFVDSHLYGVLSYYDSESPIYRPKLSKGSPFENIKELSQRDIENEERVLYFVIEGEEVPLSATQGYEVEYYCQVQTYGVVSDVYLGKRLPL